MKHLIEFATQRELDYIEAIEKYGSQTKAAKQLGVHRRTIDKAITRLKKRAALRLASEHDYANHAVPEGYTIRGVSQYIDAETGKVRGSWIKSAIDDKHQAEALKAAVEAMCEDIKPLNPVHMQGDVYKNLCNVYTLTDSHVGMLSADTDTKSGNWDLTIAEQVLVGCFAQMVNSAPSAGTCVIAQLGDYMHYSSAVQAVTELHGHALDADGRMYKMVRVAIRILRTVIDLALAKHEKVIILLAEGNHDISSSVWLRAMFQALYENEPRVEVIDSELPYYVYQHGSTMLGWHHGHLAKNEALPLLFAAQFPKVWGETTKRYVHTGHRHHTQIKEHSGITVEQHPTLAARDAYAARGGWMAERQVTAITYSDKYGQVARNTVTPEMLN
jgi:Bacterial regulatory protein, Fis family